MQSVISFILALIIGPGAKGKSLDRLVQGRESLLELLSGLDHTTHAQSKTAVKGSMDRRRSWPSKNNPDPCESSGSSDATNSDCYDRRWGMLTSYFPTHVELVRGDIKLIMTEFDAETQMNENLNQLDRDISILAGNPGTMAKPSKRDGVIHESQLLTNASSQLQAASIAAIDALYDSVINMTQISIDGTKELKTNIASAYADLMKQVKASAQRQSYSAGNNTAKMLSQGNSAFSSSVAGASRMLDRFGKNVDSATNKQSTVANTISTGTSKVSSGLSDAADPIAELQDNVEQSVADAASKTADKIGSATDNVANAGDDKAGQVAGAGTKYNEAFAGQTSDAAAAATGQWQNATTAAANKTSSVTDTLGGKVSDASASVQNNMNNVSNTASGVISNGTARIQTLSNDATTASKDMSGSVNALSGTVNTQASQVGTTSTSVQSNAQTSATDAKKKIAQMVTELSQKSGQSVQSIIQALNAAQGDAQTQALNAQGNSQQAMAQFLDQMGNDNGKIATAMSDLTQMISTSKSAATQQLTGSFNGVDATAQSAQSALGSQMNSAGTAVNRAATGFAATAGAISNNFGNQLNSGSATTVNAVKGFATNSMKTRQQLLDSMLSSSSAMTDTADDFSQSLDDLTGGMDSLGEQTSAANKALGATTDGMDNSVAALADGLAGSDDQVAAGIASAAQASGTDLNSFGQQFMGKSGSEMKKLWAKISGILAQKEKENDKVTFGIEQGEKLALDQSGNLVMMGQGMKSALDDLLSNSGNKAKLSHDGFLSKISLMNGKDNSAIAELSALNNQYKGDAFGDVSNQLTQLLNGRSNYFSNQFTDQRAQIDRLSNQVVDATAHGRKLNRVIADILKTSSESRGGVSDRVMALLGLTENQAGSFQAKIDQVSKQLYAIKKQSRLGLQELSNTIQQEVLKIPSIITSGAVRLQNDFDLAASDLDNNIVKLKEKLATAQSDEEREEANQGLIVLNKMKAIQEGVSEADSNLRKQIQANAYGGLISSENVDGAMTAVLGAMTALNAEMETKHAAVQSDTETIGKQTATLVNGMNMLISSTSDNLAQQAANAAVESRFNLNLAEARNKVRAASAINSVTSSLDKFNEQHSNASNDESGVRSDIDRMTETAKTASVALNERINDVLGHVLASSEKLKQSSVEGEGDVLTRLALVRMAMSQFLGLWNEYVQTMDRKFTKFNSNDDEFITQMDADLRARLVNAERSFSASQAEVLSLKQNVEAAMKAQDDYELSFSSRTADIKSNLKDLNALQEQSNLDSNQKLNDLVAFEASTDSQTKDSIKSMLDQFDTAMTSRAKQVTSTS